MHINRATLASLLRTSEMRIKIQDSDSKLILSCYIGPRTMASTYKFVRDLSERTKGIYQITSDPERLYRRCRRMVRGDYFSQLRKIYGRCEAGPELYGGGGPTEASR